ncbi:hypothetical protein GGTG_13037 [Gaeumannomyces tritici R3-111a-1]|uniref:Zn(2)-C6 fungal-type domain-containing protein n=1 Tax=Gaeumannomyces tritici (strain R3-111a-1) TaxID=644352 RepID=J3PHQ6_GAET3|nr:hypothetical protein GGTG_13037 [Gaeumannomyces tritici R3-111a-1]EJT69418.1 hypothetical protein GGTG_13037 [Gaeumannomyces tritici R3-111a-1]
MRVDVASMRQGRRPAQSCQGFLSTTTKTVMDPSPSSSSSCRSAPSSASGSTPLQKKFKDTCDVCSAFKIRCDKSRPSCGRCANLGQACSYSPARRAGRPRRIRPQQQQQQKQQQQQSHGEGVVSSFLDNYHVGSATGQTDFDWSSSYDWAIESLLGEANPAAAAIIAASSQTPLPLAADHHSSSTIDFTNASRHFIGEQQLRPPAVDDLCAAPRENSPATAGALLTGHSDDCARTAASIVEQLDPGRDAAGAAACRGIAAPPADGSSGSSALGNITTTACRRLLTILVCPCSEQPAVVLLVASACIALMDAVLHHHPYSDQGEFEVLARIAKVVLRFTQRYAQDGGEEGGGGATRHLLVEPIVILLRSKLQFVTEKATNRLVL